MKKRKRHMTHYTTSVISLMNKAEWTQSNNLLIKSSEMSAILACRLSLIRFSPQTNSMCFRMTFLAQLIIITTRLSIWSTWLTNVVALNFSKSLLSFQEDLKTLTLPTTSSSWKNALWTNIIISLSESYFQINNQGTQNLRF